METIRKISYKTNKIKITNRNRTTKLHKGFNEISIAVLLVISWSSKI